MSHQPVRLFAALLVLSAAVVGCESKPPATDVSIDSPQIQQQISEMKPPAKANPVRDHGYALLYALMKDESRLDGILKIKSVSPPVQKLITDIAAAARSTVDLLKQLNPPPAGSSDELSPLLSQTGLPEAEVKTRESISNATTGQLLLSGGDTFEKRLLLTQVDATNYGSHLARVVAAAEDREAAREAMKQVSERFDQLNSRVKDMLVVAPQDAVDDGKAK